VCVRERESVCERERVCVRERESEWGWGWGRVLVRYGCICINVCVSSWYGYVYACQMIQMYYLMFAHVAWMYSRKSVPRCMYYFEYVVCVITLIKVNG
jgi:hypothetical protein